MFNKHLKNMNFRSLLAIAGVFGIMLHSSPNVLAQGQGNFDPANFDLRQWTIRDNQGKDTTVMVYNVRSGVKLDQTMFKIPYTAISTGQTGNK